MSSRGLKLTEQEREELGLSLGSNRGGDEQKELRILSVLFSTDIPISPADGSQSTHGPKETYLLILIACPTVEQGSAGQEETIKDSHLSLGVMIPGPLFLSDCVLRISCHRQSKPSEDLV